MSSSAIRGQCTIFQNSGPYFFYGKCGGDNYRIVRGRRSIGYKSKLSE